MVNSLVILVAFLCFTRASLIDDYDHFAAMDPDEKIKLYWSIDKASRTVSFALDGATRGWVGFGISTGQGKMDKADMVIGWVKDGKPFLTDRHGVGHYPKLDDHNDYKLISGEESNGHTILKFSRKIDTCDQQDIKLQEGNTKVIFALNEQDPLNDVMKHTFRGIRSILLLNSQGNRNKPDPSWKYFDILKRSYTVPANHTTYHCSVHKIPEFKEKTHIVRYNPVLQRGNEGIVHHIDIMVCDPYFPEHYHNVSGDCNDLANMPAEVLNCRRSIMVAAWSIGGGAFVYPNHVGFPIGTEFTGRHFVMELHYDNPALKSGIVDRSGVRFYYTPKLRKYDAGIWTIGNKVSPWVMIPPKQEAWETTGYCTKQCTEEALQNSSLPEGGVKIFSEVLHTHLAGRSTWTKHLRNGVELPEIARDDNYDFNFQDIQFLENEVHFKPGDDLIHTCIYNTMDRDNMTYGGESTRDEMCLGFLFYYPFLPNLHYVCTTVDLGAGAQLVKKHFPSLINKARYPVNPIKTSNKTWTKEMTDDYRKFIDEENTVYPKCSDVPSENTTLFDVLIDKYQILKVKITTPLPKPKDECNNVDSSAGKIVGVLFYQIMSLCCVAFLVL